MLGGFCSVMRVMSQVLHCNPIHTKEDSCRGNMTSCYFSGCLNINSSRYVELNVSALLKEGKENLILLGSTQINTPLILSVYNSLFDTFFQTTYMHLNLSQKHNCS